MISVKRTDKVSQIADMVAKTEAALGELHLYHRFGRHQSPFPQKLYFLFSHCAHLLFSLWLDEQDSPNKVFTDSPGLTALFDKVDFGALRYLDYSRRMLYANAYEELLFRTWPLDTREQPSDCQTPMSGQAQWIVQAVEAGHLEDISKHVDKLLEGLGRCPAYSSLVETVAHVVRNGQTEWACCELPWDYLRKLDQLIGKLKFACRETKVLGGERPAEKVVTNLWPPQPTTPQEAETAVRDASAPPSMAAHPAQEIGISAAPRTEDSPSPERQTQTEEETAGLCNARKREHDTRSQTPPAQAEASESADVPAVADPASENCPTSTDLPDEVELANIASLLQPECYKAHNHAGQVPHASEQRAKKLEMDKLERLISLIVDGDDSPSKPVPAPAACQSLLWRLLEWHRPPAEGVDREPLSLVQLQRDLKWSQSQVLQEMSDLFGSKPFTLYRQKCLDKSIRSLLETCRAHSRNGIESDT